MALYVNTNVSSLNAQRHLTTATEGLNKSFERLSSGSRINSAADDAAGQSISNRMTSQVNGLDRAVSNAQDAISLAQTAEGAMDELTTSLQRMRVLAIQAQDGIHSQEDRDALQDEVNQLMAEMSRIATTTQFAGTNILDGSYSVEFLVGANAGSEQKIAIGLGLSQTSGTASGLGGWPAGGIQYGTTGNTPAGADGNYDGWGAEGLLIKNMVELGISDGAGNVLPFGMSSPAQASAAMDVIDAALEDVDEKRADLGAKQNRFQSTIRNLSNISEKMNGSRSRIEDTDFAKETAELSKNQILQQSTQTILGQANQQPNAALSLLG